MEDILLGPETKSCVCKLIILSSETGSTTKLRNNSDKAIEKGKRLAPFMIFNKYLQLNTHLWVDFNSHLLRFFCQHEDQIKIVHSKSNVIHLIDVYKKEHILQGFL